MVQVHHQLFFSLLSLIFLNVSGFETELMSACSQGRVEVVKELLQRHLPVLEQNGLGWTALLSASNNGHAEVAKVLLCHKPTRDHLLMSDFLGMTPLMYASRNGDKKVAEVLLSLKTFRTDQLLATNVDGETALMLASQHGHGEVVELLLHYNSQPEHLQKTDKNGMTAAALAENNNCSEVETLFQLYC